LSQVGKIAWFYQARIRGILDQLRQLPASHRALARLEDLDFDRYREVSRFLGWEPTIPRETFAELAASRPNAGAPAPRDWDDRVAAELEAEVGELAIALGYEHRLARLRSGGNPVRTPAPTVDDVLAALPPRAIEFA
jgi:hypothetical protein